VKKNSRFTKELPPAKEPCPRQKAGSGGSEESLRERGQYGCRRMLTVDVFFGRY